jgi:hypothetical protein
LARESIVITENEVFCWEIPTASSTKEIEKKKADEEDFNFD